MTAAFILSELQSVGTPEKAVHLSRFFKTGPGQYGEGDQFLGVVVPQTRSIAKANKVTPFDELQLLLDSPWHEARLCALLILVYRFQDRKAMPEEREAIFRFYLKNMRRCNNWDLVDLTCRDIVGEYLVDKDRSLLYRLAESENLWEQRISIVSTWAFIRRNDFGDTLELSERLIGHKHDLMHKAVGWMLREVGKKGEADAYRFLGTQRYSSSSYGASLCYRALSGTRAAIFSKEEITWIQRPSLYFVNGRKRTIRNRLSRMIRCDSPIGLRRNGILRYRLS